MPNYNVSMDFQTKGGYQRLGKWEGEGKEKDKKKTPRADSGRTRSGWRYWLPHPLSTIPDPALRFPSFSGRYEWASQVLRRVRLAALLPVGSSPSLYPTPASPEHQHHHRPCHPPSTSLLSRVQSGRKPPPGCQVESMNIGILRDS